MGHNDDLDALPLLNGDSNDIDNNEGVAGQRCNRNSRSNSSSITLDVHREQDPSERKVLSPQQQQQFGSPLPPFDIESDSYNNEGNRLHRHHDHQQQRQQVSYNIRERQQHHPRRDSTAAAARPPRSLLLARPVPLDPITDPFSLVCDIARRPKFGHQYILCPNRRERNRHGHNVGLSVGPHWSGVIYTMSIIGVITIFLVRFIMHDTARWCQPVTVACSLVVQGFLVATAIADPGIVVESAEQGEGRPFCKECSIWRPDDAEHCEECGVCIFGMDHHCPWMGKCVGRGNILWFRLFNGSWILFLSLVIISMPYFNNHREEAASNEP